MMDFGIGDIVESQLGNRYVVLGFQGSINPPAIFIGHLLNNHSLGITLDKTMCKELRISTKHVGILYLTGSTNRVKLIGYKPDSLAEISRGDIIMGADSTLRQLLTGQACELARSNL